MNLIDIFNTDFTSFTSTIIEATAKRVKVNGKWTLEPVSEKAIFQLTSVQPQVADESKDQEAGTWYNVTTVSHPHAASVGQTPRGIFIEDKPKTSGRAHFRNIDLQNIMKAYGQPLAKLIQGGADNNAVAKYIRENAKNIQFRAHVTKTTKGKDTFNDISDIEPILS